MKLRYSIGFLVLLIVSVSIGVAWFFTSLSAVTTQTITPVEFSILPNQSASEIVNKLFVAKLIKNPLATRIYLRLTEMDARLLPGAYLVSPSQNTPDLLRTLTLGPKDLWVTIPEGWRREQIAARLSETLGADSVFNPKDFLWQTATLEGRLFPDTYLIPTYATAADIVKIITDNFSAKVPSISESDLILASLVEREAKLSPDRPIIAGIFKKRLSSDWPLQVDATIQYAESTKRCQTLVLNCNWWIPPTDTTLDSPYNTYQNPGLPPTPIANPGLASIEAVLHPQSSSYWYYLTAPDGVTHFSATLEEHNLNVDKYLRP